MASGESSDSVKKELHRSKSGLRILARLDSQTSPFLLDEPHWIPDNEVFRCQQCDKTFNFTTRKHHCRRCGGIFCDTDVKHKLPLPRLSFVDPVRMCLSCANTTKKENEFFDKHLKVLTSGASFNVQSTTHSGTEERQFQCNLSVASHRYLEFQNSAYTHDNVDIATALKVQVLAVAGDAGGQTVINGITLTYKDFSDKEQVVTLRVRNDSSRKFAVLWIVAMQKAMKMLFEGRSSTK
ncbi:zinc finger FYVE domain-containing protein 21-like [Watersipora subatra]|uniref:zinc finger FYVE domain-containing protein 21-like n=1 Tax=Watersipora subatra TaxID=2589382 RepID=UPI00355B9264